MSTGYSLYLCTKVEWQGGGEKSRPHLSGQQPPVLWEVQDGLHHLVRVQEAEDVPDTWLLPQ